MADRAERPPRTDLVYGLQPVREALRGRRRVREIVCTREAAASMPWIESSGVRVSIAVADRVTALAERPDHQGVVALCDPYPYAEAETLLARPGALVVALDGVTDPRNLGAVVRSAAAFDAHGVVVPQRRAVGMTASAWRTSAGAAARIRVARAVNLARALASYQDAGLQTVGLAGDGDVDLHDYDGFADPVALVVGAEGTGLSRLVREKCDVVVRIPIAKATESLNVSVAAGIALYQAAAARR